MDNFWYGAAAGGASSLLFMMFFSASSAVRAASGDIGGFLPAFIVFCAVCFVICLLVFRFRTFGMLLSFIVGAFAIYLIVAISLIVAFQAWQPELL